MGFQLWQIQMANSKETRCEQIQHEPVEQPGDVSSKVSEEFSDICNRILSKSWCGSSNSKEFPAVAVRKDDEKEEGGDCGDQEESPEKPAVNSLCKHFPLSTDVVVSRLQVFLFQETLYYSHQIVLFSLPSSSIVDRGWWKVNHSNIQTWVGQWVCHPDEPMLLLLPRTWLPPMDRVGSKGWRSSGTDRRGWGPWYPAVEWHPIRISSFCRFQQLRLEQIEAVPFSELFPLGAPRRKFPSTTWTPHTGPMTVGAVPETECRLFQFTRSHNVLANPGGNFR